MAWPIRLGALGLIAASLGGCFWLVVGGAGEGGYVAGQKTKTTTTMSDQWITTKVKTELIATSEVKARHINVTTVDGLVTLRGIVFSEAERTLAVKIARETKGVKNVVDYLKLTQ